MIYIEVIFQLVDLINQEAHVLLQPALFARVLKAEVLQISTSFLKKLKINVQILTKRSILYFFSKCVRDFYNGLISTQLENTTIFISTFFAGFGPRLYMRISISPQTVCCKLTSIQSKQFYPMLPTSLYGQTCHR